MEKQQLEKYRFILDFICLSILCVLLIIMVLLWLI